MITIDAPISFLVGGAIALIAKNKDKPEVQNRSRIFSKGLVLQSVVLTPMILFFMLRFPDWEWNYMFNAREFFFENPTPFVGVGLIAVLTALINLSFIAGFRVVEEMIKRDRSDIALRILVATVALVGVTMVVMFNQTLHLGTYAEYQAGTAPLVLGNIEFLAVLGGGGILLGAMGFWVLRKE